MLFSPRLPLWLQKAPWFSFLTPVHPPPLSTYLSSWKQCAAETTQRSAMSVPPQMWRPRTCRLACQGHSPSTELAPPTILLRGACSPQSEEEEEETQQVLQ